MDQGILSGLSWRTVIARMISSKADFGIVWDLLVQLDPYKFMEPDEIHPRILKNLADVNLCQWFLSGLRNLENLSWLEAGQCCLSFQEGQGGLWKLQTFQSHFSVW